VKFLKPGRTAPRGVAPPAQASTGGTSDGR